MLIQYIVEYSFLCTKHSLNFKSIETAFAVSKFCFTWRVVTRIVYCERIDCIITGIIESIVLLYMYRTVGYLYPYELYG